MCCTPHMTIDMKTPLILNDPDYGTERSYKGLRLAGALAEREGDGADVGCCSTCMEARGIDDDDLTKGARHSTLDELAAWTEWADKVVTFR